MHDKRLPNVLDEKLQEELLNHYRETKDSQTRDTLILHNLRLVKRISKGYRSVENPLRDEEDLFSEGIIGLMKSLDTYDPERGSFSNHAATHIKASIRAYIRDKAQGLRVTAHAYELRYKIESFKREYEKMNHREPTLKEISKAMEIPLKKVESLLNTGRKVLSLDTPMAEDESITMAESVEDDSSSFEEEVCSSIFIEEFMESAKEYLKPEELNILRLNLGLDCREYQMTEISRIMNMKYANAERLKKEAIKKLRRSKYARELIRELDELTTWYRSPDYNYGGAKGGSRYSPVENTVLEREKLREKIIKYSNYDY